MSVVTAWVRSPLMVYLYTVRDEGVRADAGGDGALGWSELASFQAWLDRRYAYRSNEPALRPDEFLAQGGGDCDWSLFTCGLLRYWGWDPYVGKPLGLRARGRPRGVPREGRGTAAPLPRMVGRRRRVPRGTAGEGGLLCARRLRNGRRPDERRP
jgi:hypothetical protein